MVTLHKTYLLLLLLLFSSTAMWAQEKKQRVFRMGVEYGGETSSKSIRNNWDLRGNYGGYSDGYYSGNRTDSRGDFQHNYVGIKSELSYLKERLIFSSGLRLILMKNSIGRGYNDSHFFYLRDYSSSANTEFYRVKKINETLNYLSVPFEVSYAVGNWKNFALYLKVGAQLGVKVQDTASFDFVVPAMKQYENDILKNAEFKNKPFYSSVYAAFGARVMLNNGIHFNFENTLPVKQLTQENGYFFDVDNVGMGAQLSITVPTQLFFRTK